MEHRAEHRAVSQSCDKRWPKVEFTRALAGARLPIRSADPDGEAAPTVGSVSSASNVLACCFHRLHLQRVPIAMTLDDFENLVCQTDYEAAGKAFFQILLDLENNTLRIVPEEDKVLLKAYTRVAC